MLKILVYSHDPNVREQVIRALGKSIDPELPELSYTEVADQQKVIAAVDDGRIDVAILDAEATPSDGMGIAKQLRDEVKNCPLIVMLIGRPVNRWLATLPQAEGHVLQPIDPSELVWKVRRVVREHGNGRCRNRQSDIDIGQRPCDGERSRRHVDVPSAAPAAAKPEPEASTQEPREEESVKVRSQNSVPGERSKPCRRIQTGLALVAIAAGIILTAWDLPTWKYGAATADNLARYAYRDWGDLKQPTPTWVAGVQEHLAAASCRDLWLIVGLGSVLGGFAWIFQLWAISAFGRATSRYVLTAVGIMMVAGFAENILLRLTLRGTSTTLLVLVAATATIRWCAVLLAIGAIPATVGIALRGFVAWLRTHVLRSPETRTTGKNWWDLVLADDDRPQPSNPHHAISEEERSWFNAYNVPGADAVTQKRKPKPAQAICLSGGGVRSACVAMGTMQVFSDNDPIDPDDAKEPLPDGRPRRLIDTVDYVISVSGGGYSACARLLAVQPREKSDKEVGLSQRFQQGSPESDHLRRGSSYIADSPAAMIRALSEVLKNLLASMLILFTFPVILGWVAGFLLAQPYFSFAALVPVPNANFVKDFKPKHPDDYLMALVAHRASWWAVAFFAVVAVALTAFAIVGEWIYFGVSTGDVPTKDLRSDTRRRRLLSVARGSAVFALLLLTLIAGLPGLMRLCSSVVDNPGVASASIAGAVGLNYVSAIVAIAWKNRSALPIEAVTKPSWWKKVLPPGVLQLTLVLLTLAVLLVGWLITLGAFAAGIFAKVTGLGYDPRIQNVPNWEWWLLGMLLTAAFIGVVDVTSLSLHPFYRLRLARTFAVRRMTDAGRAERYDNEWTWLHQCGRVPAGGPRFVFAAAAALSGEAKPAPGLNATSYALSADYVGGPELGWFDTAKLFAEAPPRIKRDLTVQASMAVSGAAFASAMGRYNKGFEKLLAVSGARLGTWLPNPNFVNKLREAESGTQDKSKPWPRSLPTIRGAGYFYRELFGINYRDARLVQVTDGGHYENLGLVEALRRRCRLVFCIDGGGDNPPLLTGLADAMRLAEYELGVNITLDEYGDYAVGNITPGSGRPFADGHALASLNNRLTKGTVAAGRITYPAAAGLLPQRHGVLIFAKAVLWEGCPEWLLTYAASNKIFPHDPTSDQWFNEGQFAAYTELGRIMGRHAMKCVKALQKKQDIGLI